MNSRTFPRPRSWLRALGLALGAGAVALSAGCGAVRLETPPPTLPSADVSETDRQDLALSSGQVAALAQACGAGGAGHSDLYAAIAGRASAQEAALGGAWKPFATATPKPHSTAEPQSTTEPQSTAESQSTTTTHSAASPPPSAGDTGTTTTEETTPAPPAGGAGPGAGCDQVALGRALMSSAAQARAVATRQSDKGLIQLATSIYVARSLDVTRLAAIDDSPTDPSEPAGPITDANAPQLPGDAGVAAIVRNEDATGYVMEFAAARLSGDAKENLLAASQVHRRAADALATANGLTGEKDPRLAIYQVPAGEYGPNALMGLVKDQLATLPQAYFGAVAGAKPGAGREPILTALLRAEREAGGTGEALPFLS